MGSFPYYCYCGNNQEIKSSYNANDYYNKVKCLICLEEFEASYENEYYKSNCNCIIHPPCFNNYITDRINSGIVPIKCPYCNKIEINGTIVRYYLTQYKREDLIQKYYHLNINYYIMQHSDEQVVVRHQDVIMFFYMKKGMIGFHVLYALKYIV